MAHINNSVRRVLFLCLATTALAPLTAQADDVMDLGEIILHIFQGPKVDGYVAQTSSAATKTGASLVKTPITVNVVTADQMADQAAESVAEALTYTSNVLTNYRGESNIYDETFIRGFEYAPKFVNGSEFGTVNFAQLDPYLLERVEVVKGPNSVIFGQVSPGGVINMITKTPTDDAGNEIVLSFGSDNYRQLSADFQGDLNEDGTLRYRVVSSMWSKDLQGDDFGQSRLFIAPSLTWEITPDSELQLDLIYQNDPEAGQRNFYTQIGTLEPTPAGNYYARDLVSIAPEYDDLNREMFSVGARYHYSFDNGLTYRNSLRYTQIDQLHTGVYIDSLFSGEVAPLGVVWVNEDYDQLTIDNSLEAKFETGRASHTLLFGVDYQNQTRLTNNRTNWVTPLTYDLSNPTFITIADDPAQYLNGDWFTEVAIEQTGLYLQDQIEVGRLNVLLGARYDWAKTKVSQVSAGSSNTFKDEAFTGRVGFSYALENGLAPYLSYSTSFQPTTTYGGPSGGSLKPSKGRQIEFGAKWASADERILLTASYFDIEQTNLVEWDGNLGYSINIGTRRSKGFELEAKAELSDRLNMIASLGTVDAQMTAGKYAGFTAQRIPKLSAALWVQYEVVDGLKASFGLRHTGQSYGDYAESTKVPAYTLLDLGVSADLGKFNSNLKGLKASLTVTNVTDEIYVASCVAGYDDYCWYGEGREFRASLNYKW